MEKNTDLTDPIEIKEKNIIKSNTVYKDVKIGQWLYRQMRLHDKGKLPPERLMQLQTLASWRKRFPNG